VTDKWDEPEAREYVRKLMESVDRNAHLVGLAADDPAIVELMARADLVYALFPDPAQAFGFDGLIAKGIDVFDDGDDDKLFKLQAVPCISKDAALQLQARYGDSRLGMGRIH
jgi:hypothetical protein